MEQICIFFDSVWDIVQTALNYVQTNWPALWDWIGDLVDTPVDPKVLVTANAVGAALYIFSSNKIAELNREAFRYQWGDRTEFADPMILGPIPSYELLQRAGMLSLMALAALLLDRPGVNCTSECKELSTSYPGLFATVLTMVSGVAAFIGARALGRATRFQTILPAPHDSERGEVFDDPE